jgi:uncharacterized protein YggT (Ycf19 family)
MYLKHLITGIVKLIMVTIGVVLGLRILLRLFGANPDNDIVNRIYGTSGDLIEPFTGVFRPAELDGGFVIDFTSIFALLVYGLIATLLLYIINLLLPSA